MQPFNVAGKYVSFTLEFLQRMGEADAA